MSETPRTNIAAYNGHKYLRDECAALEIENRKLRELVRYVIEVSAPPWDMEKRREWDICIQEAETLLEANAEMTDANRTEK